MIFRDAAEYNMTGEGHVWIVTEQALHAKNTPDGALGLQLEHAHSDKGHIRVSGVWARELDRIVELFIILVAGLPTCRTAYMCWPQPLRR